MRIRKTTFRNDQAWLSIELNNGDYVGTWHVINTETVDYIKRNNPTDVELTKSDNKIKGIPDRVRVNRLPKIKIGTTGRDREYAKNTGDFYYKGKRISKNIYNQIK